MLPLFLEGMENSHVGKVLNAISSFLEGNSVKHTLKYRCWASGALQEVHHLLYTQRKHIFINMSSVITCTCMYTITFVYIHVLYITHTTSAEAFFNALRQNSASSGCMLLT